MGAYYFILIVSIFCPATLAFGFGGSAPLYSKNDPGIVLIDNTNFDRTILHSNTSWMVEFYSSWCGHCIRFAPIFKELGTQVEGMEQVPLMRLYSFILFLFFQASNR